jgi:UDP-N-acetylmuramate--alanine ligase
MPSWEDVPAEVARRARRGDVVVTMGAPPISLMGDELLDALAGTSAESGPARTRLPGGAGAGDAAATDVG